MESRSSAVAEAEEPEVVEAVSGRPTIPPLSPEVEKAVRELADSVSERIEALDEGSGSVRRRLVALVLEQTKRQASERLALRARRFVEQKGRCATCATIFDAEHRPVTTRVDASLTCSECERLARQRHSAPGTDPAS